MADFPMYGLSTLNKADDAEEKADRPQAYLRRVFLLGQEQRPGVVLEFLVAAGTRVGIEEIAEFKSAMRTFRVIHIRLYFAELGVEAVCSGDSDRCLYEVFEPAFIVSD